MNIFQLLKALKPGYFYNVPLDPFANQIKNVLVTHHEAGKHLVEMRNKLQEKYTVEFELEAVKYVPVWIIEKNSMEETPVVKINVIVKEK